MGGGEEVLIFEHASHGQWALLKEGIYFINPEASPRPAIEFFNFATRQVKRVAEIEKEVQMWSQGFAASPDGRWILYRQIDEREGDIMLVENFR